LSLVQNRGENLWGIRCHTARQNFVKYHWICCDLRVVVPLLTCGARHCLGCFFAGFYVLLGWILVRISLETGQSYWLVLVAGGIPIIAPLPP
jgi:hypothetical protein